MKSNLPLSENSYTLVRCWIQENGTNKFRKTSEHLFSKSLLFFNYDIAKLEYIIRPQWNQGKICQRLYRIQQAVVNI